MGWCATDGPGITIYTTLPFGITIYTTLPFGSTMHTTLPFSAPSVDKRGQMWYKRGGGVCVNGDFWGLPHLHIKSENKKVSTH